MQIRFPSEIDNRFEFTASTGCLPEVTICKDDSQTLVIPSEVLAELMATLWPALAWPVNNTLFTPVSEMLSNVQEYDCFDRLIRLKQNGHPGKFQECDLVEA